MKEKCKKGYHDFVEIMTRPHSWDDSEEIVKWCQYCGCIKINIEMDGRFFGQTMKIRAPKILTDEKL